MKNAMSLDDYEDVFSFVSVNRGRTWKDSDINHSRATMPKNCTLPEAIYARNFSAVPCGDGHVFGETTAFDHDSGQHVNNASGLLQKLGTLFLNDELSDIQIGVGHQVYPAHKLILCCSSDVFRVMLTNPNWPESQRSKIVLKEEPECVHVFEDFLRYMYKGSVHLTHYSVLPMLMLADKYNVCDLRWVCISYMCDHLVSVMQHNHAVTWLQYAYNCGHEKLIQGCYQFILWNFHKVMCTSDFLMIEKDLLVDFLSSSDLVVYDEYVLFKGVSRWLQHQQLRFNGQCYTNPSFYSSALEILSTIRFPMMIPEQLSQLEQDKITEHFSDFFLEKVVLALNYHTVSAVEGHETLSSASGDSEQYKPRNYTNDTWSTSLSIDDFASLPEHEVRPLFFSSPISGSQADDNRCHEWNVDLFPKGIHFQKCIMIGLWRNLEISGAMYSTVRLVLATKVAEVRKVDVTVIVKGVQDNVEYVKRVVQQHCMFDTEKTVCHIDDIVPFNELMCSDSEYLTGAEANSFKITIIIKPV